MCPITPHPWTPERPEETNEDRLRSIMAQLEFSHNVREYARNGIPFRTHLYVPEIHPISGTEREDDAHVLKRIATSTRAGGPNELRLERFTEALQDPDSRLTYPALTGQRKQSVRDAERLFSREMVHFMEKHGYSFEARYISVILNWRRASDERGLTELERSKFNYQMLNYLLEDLMPWYTRSYDFSTIEVNRSLTGIRGMTREVLVALTTTIESREWMRRDIASKGVQIEHPRASSTDDLECFFSVLRSMVGNHFTCKSVMVEWRKTCNEFSKRMDKDLPFYYYTSTNERFHVGERPDFNKFIKL